MERPVWLHILPDRLAVSVVSRFLRPVQPGWRPLYLDASLRHAPNVRMELRPGDYISDLLALTGVFEPARTRRFLTLARQGGLLVDVGANLGYFTLLWAAARPDNRVIAFEASPAVAPLLRRNVERNRFSNRIQIHEIAASDQAGTVSFDPGPADQTGWGGIISSGTVTVAATTLTESLTDVGPVSLLKIDTEGADALVIRGAEPLLRDRSIAEVWFEENEPRMRGAGTRPGESAGLLRSFGYTVALLSKSTGPLTDWTATPYPR